MPSRFGGAILECASMILVEPAAGRTSAVEGVVGGPSSRPKAHSVRAAYLVGRYQQSPGRQWPEFDIRQAAKQRRDGRRCRSRDHRSVGDAY